MLSNYSFRIFGPKKSARAEGAKAETHYQRCLTSPNCFNEVLFYNHYRWIEPLSSSMGVSQVSFHEVVDRHISTSCFMEISGTCALSGEAT